MSPDPAIPDEPGAGGILAPWALLPDGWSRDVHIAWTARGSLTRVDPDVRPEHAVPTAAGPVICGMPNLHSHAFQRALVGRTQDTRPGDDFWSWRQRMYEAVERLTPESLRGVSAWLFAELVAAGYTSVVEFHYLHRPGGASPLESSRAVLQAAAMAGIGITLAPVLYRRGGFDGSELSGGQRAFGLTVDEYAGLVSDLRRDHVCAVAPHSLRAVDKTELRRAIEIAGPDTPIHIHISEQPEEVRAATHYLGTSPIAWLAETVDLDKRWGLVHCTHASERELRILANSDATTVLCPTTEHDLGDGRFPLESQLHSRWGIGSDSQVSVSPGEELRQILYGMRAAAGRRSVLEAEGAPEPQVLWEATTLHSSPCAGQTVGRLEPGAAADLLVLDGSSPLLSGLSPPEMVAAWILSGSARHLDSVVARGRLVAQRGLHVRHEELAGAWRKAKASLFG